MDIGTQQPDSNDLLSCWRGRLEFPALKRQMVLLASEYSPTVILVEDKASGQSLIQELKYETALPIRPVLWTGTRWREPRR